MMNRRNAANVAKIAAKAFRNADGSFKRAAIMQNAWADARMMVKMGRFTSLKEAFAFCLKAVWVKAKAV